MAAEIPLSHLILDHYCIDLLGIVSKYIGETKKNLSRVFQDPEDGSAIFFFDKPDALFGNESEIKDAHDRYVNIEINDLFERTETDLGFEILATNLKFLVD